MREVWVILAEFINAKLLLVLQLWKLRRLMLVSSLVCLPLLTISLAYENFLLYISCTTNDISAGAVGAGYVFQAMVIPLMMIVLHEVTYRLHEYRNVHFLWFPLEVNGEIAASFCEISSESVLGAAENE